MKSQIEYVSVTQLQQHPSNPRRSDVGVIVESIIENGWFGTIVAQRSTGYVLAGNHRLLAALALDMESVPVYWVDVDDVVAKKIMLADNRSNDVATYDDEALAKLLSEVQGVGDGLVGTGFDSDDLEALLHEVMINEPSLVGLQPDSPDAKDRAADIEAAGIRSIIIPFDLDSYNYVVDRLAQIRKQHGLDTNAEALMHLLRG